MLHAYSQRLILISKARLTLRSIFTYYSSLPSVSHQRTQTESDPCFSCIDNERLDFFDHLLRQCYSVEQTRQTHARVIVAGAYDSAFLAARLVSVYSRLGLLGDAREVFDRTPDRCKSNLLLWNSILRAYVSNGCNEEVMGLYFEMKKVGVLGDGFTFPLVIRGCAAMAHSIWCKSVHCHAFQMGLHNNLHVANELMAMYSRLGKMDAAGRIFDRMGTRNYISWNTMISGFARNFDCDGAVEMFERMEFEGVQPTVVTWTSLLSSHARCERHFETIELFVSMRTRGTDPNAEVLAVLLSVCANMTALQMGKSIHGLVVKGGFEAYMIVMNSLVCVYGKQGDVKEASQLFSEIELKNTVSFNALITSYAESGFCDEAFEIFSQLKKNGSSAVRPNVITWSAVINAFASAGRGQEALGLFRQMQLASVESNAVTISTVLSVCAELAALNLGREIHGHMIRSFMDCNLLVANSLISMYMRCGNIRDGSLVFEKLKTKDLISWNSVIAGCGMHGFGKSALRYFNQMIEAGFKPDGITFVAILSACSHAGLVVEGRKLYGKMITEFRIEPGMEHHACLVDLLSRSGSLQEAREFVETMPMAPNACVWGALLNACRMYRDIDTAETMAPNIFRHDSKATGSYMLLSNIYASSGRWDDSARVRISAREKGLKKIPGQSWIELDKMVYMFLSGSTVQSDLEEVYGVLEELTLQMETKDGAAMTLEERRMSLH